MKRLLGSTFILLLNLTLLSGCGSSEHKGVAEPYPQPIGAGGPAEPETNAVVDESAEGAAVPAATPVEPQQPVVEENLTPKPKPHAPPKRPKPVPAPTVKPPVVRPAPIPAFSQKQLEEIATRLTTEFEHVYEAQKNSTWGLWNSPKNFTHKISMPDQLEVEIDYTPKVNFASFFNSKKAFTDQLPNFVTSASQKDLACAFDQSLKGKAVKENFFIFKISIYSGKIVRNVYAYEDKFKKVLHSDNKIGKEVIQKIVSQIVDAHKTFSETL